MAKKHRKYLVSYKLKSEPEQHSETIKAADAACAVGLVLDALEDDGPEQDFEWLLIKIVTPKAAPTMQLAPNARILRHANELPDGVVDAYRKALSEPSS